MVLMSAGDLPGPPGYLEYLLDDPNNNYKIIYEPGIHVLRITGIDGKSVELKWRVNKMSFDISPRTSISEVLFGQYVVYSGLQAINFTMSFQGAHSLLYEIGKKLLPIVGSPTKILVKLEYDKKIHLDIREPLRLLFADEGRVIRISTELAMIEHAVLKKVGISLTRPLLAELSLSFSLISQF